MFEPLLSALRAFVIFVGHTLLALGVILLLRGFEWLFQLIYADKEPKLVGWVPLRYIFETGDALVLGLFVVFGFLEAFDILARDRRRRRAHQQGSAELAGSIQ